jgi:hypothetical protein
MAALTFTETNGVYTATATVNSDFNVHVEAQKPCSLSLHISTVEDKGYQNKFEAEIGRVFDKDFHAAVFPKYVRIIIGAAPVSDACYITEAE